MWVGDGGVRVVIDGVGAVDNVVGGREVVATVSETDGFDGLGLLVDEDLDETALAVAESEPKKEERASLDAVADVADGGRESRRAVSMLTAWRMKVTSQGPISTNEIGKAGWRDGLEDGSGGARDPGCNIGSVNGRDGDGDNIG